jgi:tricorn protease
MWVGDVVYFLSDRNATANLFSYDPRSKQVAALTRHDDFDIMSASAGPGAIVYEQAGYIHLVDTATRKAARLTIDVAGDFPWARCSSRSGEPAHQPRAVAHRRRAAFEGGRSDRAGGEGSPRNLAESEAHDRSPVWS